MPPQASLEFSFFHSPAGQLLLNLGASFILLLVADIVCICVFGRSFGQFALDFSAKLRNWCMGPSIRQEKRESVHLGERSTDFRMLAGDGRCLIDPDNFVCTLTASNVAIPDLLQPLVDEFASEQEALKNASKHYSYNGTMAHIASFSIPHDTDAEELTVRVEIHRAQYFHFVVTNARLWADFQKDGYSSRVRESLLGDFKDWSNSVPPDLVNGLPVNLIVVTSDRKMVFSKRSAHVAIAPNAWACPINENLHVDNDRVEGEDRLDIRKLVNRALEQEIGWVDSEQSDGKCARVCLVTFGVDTGRGGYGLLGYVVLPITFDELEGTLARSVRDRFETERLAKVEYTLDGVCEAIHRNELYNPVGLIAALTLIHDQNQTWWQIDETLKRIQKTSPIKVRLDSVSGNL